MTRPLLAFLAILKDEAPNIRATLESVRHFIDSWVVYDTGSTDGTQKIVCDVLESVPGPGLFDGPFVDFATARNRVLKIHEEQPNPAIFTLMLSGDEVLQDGAAMRAFLEAHRDAPEGAYNVQMQSQARLWPYTRIFRTGAGWRYVGAVHEQPFGPTGVLSGSLPLVPGARIVHTPSDPERKVKRLREFDLPTLSKIVENDDWTLEERAYAMMFLAETCTALAAEEPKGEDGKGVPGGRWLTYQMQAMSLYYRYAQLAEVPTSPAFDEAKARYAAFMYLHIADKIGLFSSAELVVRLSGLVKAAPRLVEAHWLLAVHAAQIDARKGLYLALQAAKVARDVRADPGLVPTDARMEAMSLRVGAECARALGDKKKAHELAERAAAAGASRESMAELLG